MAMRRTILCIGLASGMLLSSSASGQKTSRKKNPYDRLATPEDYVALATMPEVIGTLLSVDGSQEVTLKVEYPIVVPRSQSAKPRTTSSSSKSRTAAARAAAAVQRQLQGQLRLQQQMLRGLDQVVKIKNPVQQHQHLQKLLTSLQSQQIKLAQQQVQPLGTTSGKTVPHTSSSGSSSHSSTKVVMASVQFALPLADKTRVARAVLEVRRDNDGKIIPYKADELGKMRDPKMPGFRADLADLQVGQLVRIYLGKSKATAKNKAPARTDSTEAANDSVNEDTRPPVRMVLILSDVDTTAGTGTPANKRQKK
jgi:hypothetical protein